MKLITLLSGVVACLALNSCCSSCGRFWDEVEVGNFSDPTYQAAFEKVLEARSPGVFKSTARVFVRRSGSELAFTLYAKADRNAQSVQLAGMTDIGNVIFAMLVSGDTVSLKKNTSRWDESLLKEMLGPLCKTILIPSLSDYHIVQEDLKDRLMHRSRKPDGSIETYFFDKKGTRWVEYKRQSFAMFGEFEYVQRVIFSEFRSVDGVNAPFPHHIEIVDDRYGFKAEISIGTLTPL